ncbi:hypothetical protein NEF87_003726 [Candidatus Lokiarchaeum ossiferum]|uniref:Zinc-ribbon domain-containing protein n=1 Tax=Candidatus Lokiarchaeum ossiferum TaxID=2951803 RepID=A0ABY6HV97_9ARCH|nr:hypothetical protein NEF87_003726 [Candidatus Lokiarchaeum sp. B-35]
MKLFYPYPVMFESDPAELIKYNHSVGMLALTPEKNIEIVQELYNPSIWRSFWTQVSDKELEYITLEKDPSDDPKNITWISTQIVKGLEYIIKKGYVFIGLLHLGPQPFDKQITEERSWFRRKTKYFENMPSNYHQNEIYPDLEKKTNSIYTQFIGTGEKFFRQSDSLEKLELQQLSQMSAYFRGSLCGIFGTNIVSKKRFQFVILSQNITKEKTLQPLSLDKKGRDTVEQLIKMKQFSPTGGFKLDYGIWALQNLPQWRSMEILPQFSKPILKYNQYLKDLMAGNPSHFEYVDTLIPSNPFNLEKVSEMLAHDERNEPQEREKDLTEKTQTQLEKIAIPPLNLTKITTESQSTPNSQLEKPELAKIALKPLKTIAIPKIEKTTPNKLSESQPSEEEYEDVFNRSPSDVNFNQNDNQVMDPNNMDKILQAGTAALESDFGDFGSIDPSLMAQQDIFKDLEASLAAMSELDDLAQKDEAISRVFYPPPTLISYANKEGMQIGGSVCMISMGVGRNIWMIPELRRMQMWANFWSQEEVEGNPQIKDFIAMDEKDIESPDELEDMLQKAFIRIRRNNQIFLGLTELEGNGFEDNVFEELELPGDEIQKLIEIHHKRRTDTEFPKITQDSWIEMRYFGRAKTIEFLTNPNSHGALDIAADSVEDPRFQKGKICGIMCVDEEAANLFILSDNLDDLSQEITPYSIDQSTLQKMFTLIESEGLTPVSWCKMSFGYESFETLSLWDDIKDGVIFPIIREKYEQYIQKMLHIKRREDNLRLKIEAHFPDFHEFEETMSENAIKCPNCGTENPDGSNFCVACGNKIVS